MKIKILCMVMLIMLSTSILFSEESKETLKILKIFTDTNKGFILKTKSNENKEDIRINQLSKIQYPQKFYNCNLIAQKNYKKIENNISYRKNEDSKITTNNNIEIRQSSKIQYPKDRLNIRENFSKKNTWYNIKIYPNYNNDNFKKIKTINAINNKMKIQINKEFALIGPILEDNLGTMTKILTTKGYNDLEYIKIE
ncbi:hypothetical protein F0310_00485 [Borrelia sp. A-FGy1]|uniref:hypothetical protein n=1 Tax=Borrelia sp. A-FGy1 TaxID=2608247 RepID=UPI0015F69B42|nr:hypothetical protein [Borrelia sp. A-FGy1]QMU98913.1 hypothetical protein F0310_00485 [Borrelia sp. A-FGy1]